MVFIARVAIADIPHHITQRGNRRLETILAESEYRKFLNLMAEWFRRCRVQVWPFA